MNLILKDQEELNDIQGVPIVNRYRGPNIKPKQGDITMWKDTLNDVFDDAARADSMEQYIAWCLQNQGEKSNVVSIMDLTQKKV